MMAKMPFQGLMWTSHITTPTKEGHYVWQGCQVAIVDTYARDVIDDFVKPKYWQRHCDASEDHLDGI
jgi:hypothetical protein